MVFAFSFFLEQCFMHSGCDVSFISAFCCLGLCVSLLLLFLPYTRKIQKGFGCTVQE